MRTAARTTRSRAAAARPGTRCGESSRTSLRERVAHLRCERVERHGLPLDRATADDFGLIAPGGQRRRYHQAAPGARVETHAKHSLAQTENPRHARALRGEEEHRLFTAAKLRRADSDALEAPDLSAGSAERHRAPGSTFQVSGHFDSDDGIDAPPVGAP